MFRRHVRRSSGAVGGAIAGNRETEVGDARATATIDHHVRRFEIAMNDAFLMRGRNTCADVATNSQRFFRREPADAAKQRREIFAIDEFHRDEEIAVRFADVVQAADVRMRDLSSDAHLFVQKRGVFAMRDKLQRDDLSELQIIRAINLAHSAASNQRHDAIAIADDRSGRELQRASLTLGHDDGRRLFRRTHRRRRVG